MHWFAAPWLCFTARKPCLAYFYKKRDPLTPVRSKYTFAPAFCERLLSKCAALPGPGSALLPPGPALPREVPTLPRPSPALPPPGSASLCPDPALPCRGPALLRPRRALLSQGLALFRPGPPLLSPGPALLGPRPALLRQGPALLCQGLAALPCRAQALLFLAQYRSLAPVLSCIIESIFANQARTQPNCVRLSSAQEHAQSFEIIVNHCS